MAVSQYTPTIERLVDEGLAVAREGLGFSSDLYKNWEATLGEHRNVLVTIIDTRTNNTWATDLFQVGILNAYQARTCKHWRVGWDKGPGVRDNGDGTASFTGKLVGMGF